MKNYQKMEREDFMEFFSEEDKLIFNLHYGSNGLNVQINKVLHNLKFLNRRKEVLFRVRI